MYSLNRITTTVDCDVLLTWAQAERSEIDLKRTNEAHLAETFTGSSLQIDALIIGITAQITAHEAYLNALSPGPLKVEAEKEKTRLVYKKFQMENRKETYGSVALVEKEVELQVLEKKLTEYDAFIAAVTAHKATLPIS